MKFGLTRVYTVVEYACAHPNKKIMSSRSDIAQGYVMVGGRRL